jgi:hypothetical protein
MNLALAERMRLQFSEDSSAYGELYTSAGERIGSLGSGYGTDETVPAGSYLVVVHAGSGWAQAFAEQGNKVDYSAPVTLEEYVEPPTIDGYPGSATGSAYSFSSDEDFEVMVPEGNEVDLVLEVTDADFSDMPGTLAVSVDGEPATQVVAQRGQKQVIPLPADSASHALRVWITASDYSYAYADFELSFQEK